MTPPPPRTRAVILAAGLGTRMKSRLPKVLHPICGRPMLAYVIDAAREATGEKPLVVYSPATAQIRDVFADEADFALQAEPRGTGDALRAALEALPDDVEEIVVLSGDVPLIEPQAIADVIARRRGDDSAMTVTAFHADDPRGYGRIVRANGDGSFVRIVEEKDASDEELQITEVNAGLYGFDVPWLRESMPRLEESKASGEVYLTQLVEVARTGDRVVNLESGHSGDKLTGINDRTDLLPVEARLNGRIILRHLEAGVTIHDPFFMTTSIEATVEIEPDVTIEANVTLRGRTKIGRDTVIRAGSQIIDSTIGERCTIWASVIENSSVGDDVRVGPFSHLRGGCVVGDGAEIGNYAEMKGTRFGARSKMHHFGYLGDAEVGDGVNIGAGTITANYDGRNKNRTVIGDGAFIGSDTILRAPVTIGEGAYTGAGSVVTKDVPPGKLAVGVPARIRERRAPEPPAGEEAT